MPTWIFVLPWSLTEKIFFSLFRVYQAVQNSLVINSSVKVLLANKAEILPVPKSLPNGLLIAFKNWMQSHSTVKQKYLLSFSLSVEGSPLSYPALSPVPAMQQCIHHSLILLGSQELKTGKVIPFWACFTTDGYNQLFPVSTNEEWCLNS